VVLGQHPDHTGGPAHSKSVSSISVIAPLMWKVEHFFMRRGAPTAHGLLVAKSNKMLIVLIICVRTMCIRLQCASLQLRSHVPLPDRSACHLVCLARVDGGFCACMPQSARGNRDFSTRIKSVPDPRVAQRACSKQAIFESQLERLPRLYCSRSTVE
jgi:hypothetical protein